MPKPLISVVASMFNEEGNVEPLCERIFKAVEPLSQYDWEIVLIDNCSQDATVERAKAICARDKRVKLIVNARNFGHIRSPYHALMQARGAAVIGMASDLQDPPEMIPELLRGWEEGFKMVACVRTSSVETGLMPHLRRAYYKLMGSIAEARPLSGFTGFGLYDRRLVEVLREMGDPYPYLRGMVSEVGFPIKKVPFHQEARHSGITKNNWLSLADMALLGVVSLSRLPIRLATLAGAGLSAVSFVFAVAYLVFKLIFWDRFSLGAAPVLIGLFFFASVQLLFLGLIGEYIGAIHQKLQNRPLVVEAERVNFEPDQTPGAPHFAEPSSTEAP
jgi:polyisoprenyl-phosphate glycosyltransferase